MKRLICFTVLFAGVALLSSCASSGGGSGVYRHYHGHSPFYRHYDYYRGGGVIVVPDEPVLEAVPLPSGPEMMPDMGMPVMDFGMDF